MSLCNARSVCVPSTSCALWHFAAHRAARAIRLNAKKSSRWKSLPREALHISCRLLFGCAAGASCERDLSAPRRCRAIKFNICRPKHAKPRRSAAISVRRKRFDTKWSINNNPNSKTQRTNVRNERLVLVVFVCSYVCSGVDVST